MAIGLPTSRGSTGMFKGIAVGTAPAGGQKGRTSGFGTSSGSGFQGSSTAIGASPVQVGAQPASASMLYGPGANTPGGAGGAGGGGGSLNTASSSGGGSQQPAVTFNPSEMNISAQQNPQLAALQGSMAQYRGALAGNTDQDATLAMQRQRDLISGMSKEFGEDAAARGIGGTGAAQQDLLKRVVNPGQQALAGLNAQMASEGRNRQLQALQAEGGLANQQAQLMQAQQNFGLQSWEARNAANLAAAQLQAQQQMAQTNQASQLASLLGSFYSGF